MARHYSAHDEDRRRMIDETNQFIAWGLAHPQLVRWIPRRRVGTGTFSQTLQLVFWTPLLGASLKRPVSWLKSLLRKR